MKNIEVEFRFRVSDEKKAREFLDKLEFIKRFRQKDVYFDTEPGDMFKRGIFIRARDGRTLDFKFNLEDVENRHEDCDEHSFALPLSDSDAERLGRLCRRIGIRAPPVISMPGLLMTNDLKEFVVIEKVREKFSDGDFTYTLDDVKGFGLFLEIEAMAMEGSDFSELKRRMLERIRGLNPKFLPTGYVELFVKKLNPGLYMQGRYLLDEDKQ